MKTTFDLIVLGAGSGGLAAAKRAASYGARVAIVEGDRVGGTCVIRGCVPKKLLVYGSLYKEQLETATNFGVNVRNSSMDVAVLLSNVRDEVDRLNLVHIDLLSKANVELVRGWGRFINSNCVRVYKEEPDSTYRDLYASKILIAVGGNPQRPSILGAELGWVSDDMFLQKDFPPHIVVVGGGYIACEFSSILNGLGVNVTQLVRSTYLLRGFDREISGALLEEMQNKGIKIYFEQDLLSIQGSLGDLEINTKNGEKYFCGGLLFATGRLPLTSGLNLDTVGINLSNKKIPVNNFQETATSNIFAVGDVTNRVNLTPVAIEEGRVFADRVFGGIDRRINYNLIASAVFSNPELASVGLTEEQAIELYGSKNLKIYRTRFRPMSKALSKSGSKCLLKLIINNNNNKVLGCHMLGENAAEIIQMAAIPVGMGATKFDFDKTMALHPTVAEEFVTMI